MTDDWDVDLDALVLRAGAARRRREAARPSRLSRGRLGEQPAMIAGRDGAERKSYQEVAPASPSRRDRLSRMSRMSRRSGPAGKAAVGMTHGERDAYEERAAIAEFDGGLPRPMAEALARKEVEAMRAMRRRR